MLLDIVGTMIVAAVLLALIGICLLVYGKELFKHTSFYIGALTGGVLAYMVLEGFLGPYGIPLIVKVLISFAIVFLGGLAGQGASAMFIAFIISMAVIDLIFAYVPDDLRWTAFVAGTLMFVLVILIVQRFLHFFTALTGGLLMASSLHPAISGLGPQVTVSVQIAVAIALGIGGYFIQRKLDAYLQGRNEEIVWVPTPPKKATAR
jgi:hypothetical protein